MNETLKTIHSLATTHGTFTDKPVGPDDLEAVVQASLRAANASARQSYSLVAVEDAQLIRQLCGYRSPAGIVYCVDFNRVLDIARHLGEPFAVGGMISFITGSTDTVLAAQNGAIAAKSLGLDYMFTNGIHRGDVERVYRLLDLPEKYCVPLIMLLLGYAEKPALPRGRLGGEGVVHRGKYNGISAERAHEIAALFDDRKNRYGLKHFEETGESGHYYHWFFNEWTRDDPKRAEIFEALLRKTGFLK
jgi:nitroreductase